MPRRDDWDDEDDYDRPRRPRRRKPGVPAGVWVGLGVLALIVVASAVVVATRRGGPALGLPGLAAGDPAAAEDAIWQKLVGEWECRPSRGVRRVLRFTPDRSVDQEMSAHSETFSHGQSRRGRVVGITVGDRGRFVLKLSRPTVPGEPEATDQISRLHFEGDLLVHNDTDRGEEYRYTRVATPKQ